jgi:hypothetical protein
MRSSHSLPPRNDLFAVNDINQRGVSTASQKLL